VSYELWGRLRYSLPFSSHNSQLLTHLSVMVSRDLRLRHEFDVRQTRSRGKAQAEGPIVLRVLRNTLDPAQNRYAFVAGKRVGNAVARNRLKRLCREAIRHLNPLLTEGYDFVVIVRGTTAEMPDYATARATLERLLIRSRVLTPEALASQAANEARPEGNRPPTQTTDHPLA
jgi:ribonuclease P protein component